MRALRYFFANRRWQILLLVVIPCALFFVMRARLSWRPRVLGQVQGEVTAMTWSPDNNWLAVTTALEDASAPLEIWNVPQRKRHGLLKTKAGFHNFVQFSSDSNTLFALDGSFVLRRWSVVDKSEQKPSPQSVQRLSFALSPDGLIFVQNENGIVGRRVLDGALLWRLDDPLAVVALARFSPDGKRLALLLWQSAFAKGAALVVWNLDSAKSRIRPEKIVGIKPHHAKSYGLVYDVEDNLAYLMGSYGEIFCYDLQAGSLKTKFDPRNLESPYWGASDAVASVAPPELFAQVMPASGPAPAGGIEVRQWPPGKTQRILRGPNKVSSFRLPTFSPDGGALAAVDDKGFITLWRIK